MEVCKRNQGRCGATKSLRLNYIKRKKPHNCEAFKNILEMTVKLI